MLRLLHHGLPPRHRHLVDVAEGHDIEHRGRLDGVLHHLAQQLSEICRDAQLLERDEAALLQQPERGRRNHPAGQRVTVDEVLDPERLGREHAGLVQGAADSHDAVLVNPNRDSATTKRRAAPQRDLDARNAGGRFHRRHVFRPVRVLRLPVIPHQPQNTVRRPVSRLGTHLAQQFLHRLPLSCRVDPREVRFARTVALSDLHPEDTVLIAVTGQLVHVTDAAAVRAHDQAALQVLLSRPRGHVWRDDEVVLAGCRHQFLCFLFRKVVSQLAGVRQFEVGERAGCARVRTDCGHR
ncbi:hypothetical protein [Nocardia sp. NRRL S-836]|uniref:hypothetical protein n=1 Tax=Nocardia sp. NRRL S-836 TaxID=1519492 RepID=UPI0012F8FC4C|nr:hypothetical protein [Nocardia sp. NRRL S-836]